jgi:hypothetical protein
MSLEATREILISIPLEVDKSRIYIKTGLFFCLLCISLTLQFERLLLKFSVLYKFRRK